MTLRRRSARRISFAIGTIRVFVRIETILGRRGRDRSVSTRRRRAGLLFPPSNGPTISNNGGGGYGGRRSSSSRCHCGGLELTIDLGLGLDPDLGPLRRIFFHHSGHAIVLVLLPGPPLGPYLGQGPLDGSDGVVRAGPISVIAAFVFTSVALTNSFLPGSTVIVAFLRARSGH